jgi:hypothetical protein
MLQWCRNVTDVGFGAVMEKASEGHLLGVELNFAELGYKDTVFGDGVMDGGLAREPAHVREAVSHVADINVFLLRV